METDARAGPDRDRAVPAGRVAPPLSAAPPGKCRQCGAELAPGLLACPACGALVHADTLKQLADQAAEQRAGGDVPGALAAWRQALDLLPAGTRQREIVTATIDGLSRELDHPASESGSPNQKKSRLAKGTAGLGTLGVLLAKFKTAIFFILAKGKLLLLGLTKAGTLLSMLLAFGVYWTLWGWRFALGFVVSIYIHEMGHVAALSRLGIKATPPMFIPGIGAVVRLQQYPVSPREDARVGLAGPIWGLGAALAASGIFLATGEPIWGAIARVGAWINLFNLIPVWQLDGARGLRPLNRLQHWVVVAVIGGSLVLTGEHLLILLLLAAAYAAWRKATTEEGDSRALIEYAGLTVVLSLLTTIPVPTA